MATKKPAPVATPWQLAIKKACVGQEARAFQSMAKKAPLEQIEEGLGLWREAFDQKNALSWMGDLRDVLIILGEAAVANGAAVDKIRAPGKGKHQGPTAWDLARAPRWDPQTTQGAVVRAWARAGAAPWGAWKKMHGWGFSYPRSIARMVDVESAAFEMGLAWVEHGAACGLDGLGGFCAARPSEVENALKGLERAKLALEKRLEDWTLDPPHERSIAHLKDFLSRGFGRAQGVKMLAPFEEVARSARERRDMADGWLGACECAFASDNAALARMALSGAAAFDPRALRRAARRSNADGAAVEGLWAKAARHKAWSCVNELFQARAWMGARADKGELSKEEARVLASMRDQAAMAGGKKDEARQALESAGKRVAFELQSGGLDRAAALDLTEKGSLFGRRAVGAKRASEKERLAMAFTLALGGEQEEAPAKKVAPKRI
jgi:hypothetical protein